jgi:hypothetical protein
MKPSRQSLLAAALIGWSLLLARSAMAEEAGTADTADTADTASTASTASVAIMAIPNGC